MNHQEALIWLDEVQALGIKLGLETMRALLRELGDPQDSFPAVVVAGTNGKGSVSAFIASVLSAAGLRAGLYTSPHLIRYEERIAVAGRPIGEDRFAAAVTRVRETIDGMRAGGRLPSHPTHFEILTAAAFLHFRDEAIDVGVLEVGMGGRHDAVAAARGLVAVITNIGLEHTRYLGDTLEAIAAEKAGVIHDGCQVVTGESRPGPLAVIRAAAQGRGVRIVERHHAAQVEPSHSAASGRFRLKTLSADYGEALLGLAGRHQVENATLAVLAVEALAETGGIPGPIAPTTVVEGLARAHWPGRLQILGHAPLFLVDGAHNPAGAAALARALRDMAASGLYHDLTLVFGVLEDKDAASMARELFPLADHLILARGRSPRFRDPGELVALAGLEGHDVRCAGSTEEALELARGMTPANGAICVCGSLYLVGEAMEAMKVAPYP